MEVLFHSSVIADVTVVSHAIVGTWPCPNSYALPPLIVTLAARVVAKDPARITNRVAIMIRVRLRAPRPPNREPIRPLSGEFFANAYFSSCMCKG